MPKRTPKTSPHKQINLSPVKKVRIGNFTVSGVDTDGRVLLTLVNAKKLLSKTSRVSSIGASKQNLKFDGQHWNDKEQSQLLYSLGTKPLRSANRSSSILQRNYRDAILSRSGICLDMNAGPSGVFQRSIEIEGPVTVGKLTKAVSSFYSRKVNAEDRAEIADDVRGMTYADVTPSSFVTGFRKTSYRKSRKPVWELILIPKSKIM